MKLNKSQEELDNEKKWDKAILLLLAIIFYVIILMITYDKIYEEGHRNGYNKGVNDTKKGLLGVPKEISILAEQKKCAEIGGKFNIYADDYYTHYIDRDGTGFPDNGLKITSLTCTSPAKELFKHEIK